VSYRITDECIACGACQAECPEKAITEGDERSTINAAVCSDCGTCAEVCPVGACVPE
jgi:ferredoxin